LIAAITFTPLKIFAKIQKISFQPTQKQVYTTKKSKKGDDIETRELLYPAAFSLFQITK